MLAEYNGNIYIANVKKNKVILMTYNQNKCTNGFVSQKNYYKYITDIKDSLLKNIYDISYFVDYKDETVGPKTWLVNENRAVGLKADIEHNLAVIDISFAPPNNTWIPYDNGASSKQINLLNCSALYIEKNYIKYNGEIKNVKERTIVDLIQLKNSIISNRICNL